MNSSNNLPMHVGIILDGNGRWATKRCLPRSLGHKAGIEAVKRVIDSANEIGLKIISLYAFSTENWKRDKKEIDTIFNLLRDYLRDNKLDFIQKNIKILTMGDITQFPTDLYEKLIEITEDTKNCTGLIVNLAVNYGSRTEIIRAVNQIIKEKQEKITESNFNNYLYSKGLPDPDLVIRTSGEQRLSNFMLYQVAYSEFYFPKIDWPDFNKKELLKAIKVYQKRDRRFGGIKEKNK